MATIAACEDKGDESLDLRVRPWAAVRWHSASSAEDCQQGLLSVAVDRSQGSPFNIQVVKTGALFRIAMAGRPVLAGRPYLDVHVIRSGTRTVLVGRFNPDPVAMAAIGTVLCVLVLGILSGLSIGLSALVTQLRASSLTPSLEFHLPLRRSL